MPHTSIVLLAAGGSTRMGTPKQLLDFRGQPMLRHAIQIALAVDSGPVMVVLGANELALRTAVGGLPITLLVNDRWPQGMGTSIQTGLREVESSDSTGMILALADQPFVTPEFLHRLVTVHHETGKSIVASHYSGTVGVPAYFARAVFPRLRNLPPDQGCKGIISDYPLDVAQVDCPEAAMDIDTPEDYSKARKEF